MVKKKETTGYTSCFCVGLTILLLFAGLSFANASNLSKEAANTVQSLSQQQGIQITGVVVDNYGEEIIGATVRLKSDPTVGVATNIEGKFTINVGNMDEVLIISFLGKRTVELALTAGTIHYNVTMTHDEAVLDEFVVEGGIVQRDRASFTGAAHTISQAELKAVGNLNVIQALRTLDPSFVIVENLSQGSNPNAMAAIELRGQTGLDLTGQHNPNMPLFIMDGFQATVEEVNDLDINRIRSITLLKDASSTAIFGARGANGVVVIETVRPAPGRIQVTYNATMRLDWADLSQYNLMNAGEKLEFERLAGAFGNLNDSHNETGLIRYQNALRRIAAGVDTYWLDMPVRLGVTNDHSLNISGGDNVWLFTAGVNYRNVQGVMKGSSRESYSGNIRVMYRGVNNLNISNNLTVGGVNSRDGAWTTGNSFAAFANASPHYVPFDEYGQLVSFLDARYLHPSGGGREILVRAANPLYNASLASFNAPSTFTVTNNTHLNWHISPQWRVTADMSIRRESIDGRSFVDPKNTRFAGQPHTIRGEYVESRTSAFRYSAGANVTYTTSLLDAHNFTFTGRTSIEEATRITSSFIARGFPDGADPIPSLAYSFLEGSRPMYIHRRSREVAFIFLANYNYKLRYLIDFTFNNAGSTTFGRHNLFDQFYSIGLGWNVDRETFAQDWNWFDELRIRGTHGTNANQLTGMTNASVFGYWPGSDIFGTAARLTSLGNQDLEWMRVTRTNVGFDATFIARRLRASFDVFQTLTDPLALNLPRRASAGVSSFPMNLGTIEGRGYEFRISYDLIRNVPARTLLTLRLTGAGTESRFYGIEDALNLLNQNLFEGADRTTADMLRMFADGSRTDALFAVRSLGIDPSSGREVFQRRDGTTTFDFDPADRVEIAHSNPILQGVFGATLLYNRLTVGFDIRYQLGAHQFNQALFNKVENITHGSLFYNQDRRALHDRWQNPGDVSRFRGITLTDATQMSSRFIQRNNMLRGESVRVSWDFSDDLWISALGLQDLRATASMQDFFFLSTMRTERGIDFPFARGITFNLSARF